MPTGVASTLMVQLKVFTAAIFQVISAYSQFEQGNREAACTVHGSSPTAQNRSEPQNSASISPQHAISRFPGVEERRLDTAAISLRRL